MTLYDAPALVRLILSVNAIFSECVSIYIILKNFYQKRVIPIKIHDFIIFGLTYFAAQILADISSVKGNGAETLSYPKLARMPLWVFLLYVAATFVIFYFKMRRLRLVKENRLTTGSIRQTMDVIPDGLCCYTTIGIPRLVNKRMERLCWEIIGAPMGDAADFWDRLSHGRLKEGVESVRGGDNPIVKLSDGRVISFTRKSFITEGHKIYEVVATDISSVYDITTTLRESNQRLTEMNKRLKKISESITQMTIDREVLDTKIAIHDNLGSMLLSTRRYLSKKDKMSKLDSLSERRELIRSWKQNVTLLLHERAETRTDEYVLIQEAAFDVGMKINIKGTLPPQPEIKKIVATAMHECMTNTMRHAGGDELYITIVLERHFSEEEAEAQPGDVYTVEIKNNGAPPAGPIFETGGLGSLHQLVVKYGGEMIMEWKPEFVLRLILPV